MPSRTSLLVALCMLGALSGALGACSPAGSAPHAKPAQPAEPTRASQQPRGGTAPQTAAPTVAAAERGRELYAQMCAVCHGARGEGYKADEATALAHPDFLAAASDAFIRRAIAHGRKGTTMSAWARERGGPLAARDIDALLAFVRTWDVQPRAVLDQRAIEGDPEAGARIYARDCVKCHGERGVGGPNVRIGDADFFQSAGAGFVRHAIAKGRSGTTMPAFATSLGDRGIENVIAYLLSVVANTPATPRAVPSRPPPIPLGPVPLHPRGPEPVGFSPHPGTTSVDIVHAQLKRGARMALLDARAPSDYAEEHIAGAVSVPFYDPAPYLKDLPKDAWLVSYCACPHAESMSLAGKLVDNGFKKVTVLAEGLNVWKARKYPTHKGTKP